MGKGRTLERKRRVRPKAWSKNSELHAEGRRVPKRREVSRKASREEKGESISGWVDAKALQEDQESLGFIPSLAKPEMGKEVGRRRASS